MLKYHVKYAPICITVTDFFHFLFIFFFPLIRIPWNILVSIIIIQLYIFPSSMSIVKLKSKSSSYNNLEVSVLSEDRPSVHC